MVSTLVFDAGNDNCTIAEAAGGRNLYDAYCTCQGASKQELTVRSDLSRLATSAPNTAL